MSATEQRIQIAQAASKVIDPIANAIMEEWKLSFSLIQSLGKEAEFDREILKRIEKDPIAKSIFGASRRCTADNYGTIWKEFTGEQQNIIALKDRKNW